MHWKANSFEMLSIDGKQLKSSFDLSLVANASAWEQVFQELALRDNEVLKVNSMNHAISIQKNNNQYYFLNIKKYI